MQTRKLGNNGLEVSAVGLGCMGMSQSYFPIPDRPKRRRATIARRRMLATSLTKPEVRPAHPSPNGARRAKKRL